MFASQPTLSADRLGALDVVQVPGIVADLVDARCHRRGDAIVLLQIDRKRDALGLRADLLQRGDLLLVVDGDPDDAGAGCRKLMHLRNGSIDVARLGGAHALDDHRRGSPPTQ